MDINLQPQQPMQPQQPIQPNRPMPNQPISQPGYNQPYNGPQGVPGPMPNQPFPPMGQPMPPQPMMQPMMKPPKQPMDPAKKKKIILGFSIGGAVLVLGVIVVIVISILLHVDYGQTYAVAKELKPKIYEIYQSYDCERVVDYVDSTYTNQKTYSEYIEKCKEAYSNSTDELITRLENTDGVKKNEDLKNQFAKFKSEYTALSAGDIETLSAKLDLWQARHNFIYTANDLSYGSSSDSEYTTAANYLINSGNDALKTYGEGWLEKQLAISSAYRAWYNSTYSSGNKTQLYNDYNNKKKEKQDWVAANKPDINTVAPLYFDDTSKMYTEFNKLYNMIIETYEKNYNHGSGDCTEFLGEVSCD